MRTAKTATPASFVCRIALAARNQTWFERDSQFDLLRRLRWLEPFWRLARQFGSFYFTLYLPENPTWAPPSTGIGSLFRVAQPDRRGTLTDFRPRQ